MKASFVWSDNPVEIDLDQRVIIVENNHEKMALMYMPGYDGIVMIRISGTEHPVWGWNGDVFAPTFSPSILTRQFQGPDCVEMVNHVFVRCGSVEFLRDCTHSLAGKTIPLPKLCEWPEADRLWD